MIEVVLVIAQQQAACAVLPSSPPAVAIKSGTNGNLLAASTMSPLISLAIRSTSVSISRSLQ